MSSRTNTYNAYESGLSSTLGVGATSVAVDSAAGLVEPVYLVIDPDVPAKREWVRVNTINGNTLENMVRNLEGSVGDVEHDSGAKIRAVYTMQIQDDIFDDIEADELNLTQHETDGGDPHSQAGYLKQSETDALYLKLTGGTLSGFLTLFADPTLALQAATKQYVDAEVAAQDHDHATPIAAHNVDVASHDFLVTGKVNKSGDSMSGILQMSSNKITGVTDGADPLDAVNKSQLDSVSGGTPSNHDDLGARNLDDNHTQYLTNAKGDARYYTQTQQDATDATIDARLDALEAAPPAHNHTAAQTTSGTFLVARIPDLNASKIDAGTFGTGNFTFPGSVGIAGAFNANSTVDFSGLSVNAGGVQLRLVGSSMTKAS